MRPHNAASPTPLRPTQTSRHRAGLADTHTCESCLGQARGSAGRLRRLLPRCACRAAPHCRVRAAARRARGAGGWRRAAVRGALLYACMPQLNTPRLQTVQPLPID
eukprot:scaffold80063_cov53-Phaeocystis_antarctica.AAC.2